MLYNRAMADIFVSDKKEPALEDKLKRVGDTKEVDLVHDHTKNPLAAFCYLPDSIYFLNQDPEEKVVLFLRRHPITNVGAILVAILFFIAPSAISGFPLFGSFPGSYKLIFLILWYLIGIAYSYEKFLDWFFSVFIVTDERVIDVDFINLIYREITTANIDKIQDVTVQAGGAAMALFNYGNVYIQTASEVPNIEFNKVPKPDKVSRVLRNLILQEEQEKIEGRIR